MKNLRLFGTGATIATFAIMSISGVLLYLGFRFGNLKAVHEYIGLAMVVACIAHVAANWRAFLSYFKGKTGIVIISCALVLGIISAVSLDDTKSAHMPKKVYAWTLNLSLEDAISTFGSDKIKFEKFLSEKGFKFENITIKEFSQKNGIKAEEIIDKLLPKK